MIEIVEVFWKQKQPLSTRKALGSVQVGNVHKQIPTWFCEACSKTKKLKWILNMFENVPKRYNMKGRGGKSDNCTVSGRPRVPPPG